VTDDAGSTVPHGTPAAEEPRLLAGRYRLGKALGSGGMGTVWQSEDILLGREVAVKELRLPHALPPEERRILRERTFREARTAARLDHPSAVTVYDVVDVDDRPWLVMEFVEGRSLADAVRDDGPLSPAQTAELGLAVLGALEAAHRVGVLHRDVKPGNVLLRDDGRVVLTDFGIATTTGDSSITSTGLLLGSPAYIAPERARGITPGPASDLWSLGATLYTAVEGRPPFEGPEPVVTLTRVVSEPPEPPQAAGPLTETLLGLLEKDPDARWDAATTRAALRRVAGDSSEAATTALPVADPTGSKPDRTAVVSETDVSRVRDAADPGRRRATPAAAPSGGARRLLPLLAGLLAVALLAAGAVLLVRGLDGADAPAVGDLGIGSGAGTEEGPVDVGEGPVPADWTTYTNPAEGWSVAHPPNWEIRERGEGSADFVDPDGGRFLRVDRQEPAGDSAIGAWEELDETFSESREGYELLRLEEIDYRDLDAADWEFRHSDGGIDVHAIDRGFIVDGDDDPVGYALFLQSREDLWDVTEPLLDAFAASFRVD
jgi:eukaryotic-like serine/threonine-protein kinase